MLKVFISSTFRDLETERRELIRKLDETIEAAAMEKFIPHGETSHKDAVDELRKSDVVIFLISPHYGSLLKTCVIKDCKAECGMKAEPKERISYTHCEYTITKAEGKPHQTYRVEPLPESEMDEKTKKDFRKRRKKFETFEKEVRKEFCPEIVRTPEDMEIVLSHLAQNIVRWYLERKIQLHDFRGRREELKELLDKMDKGSVEVYGVGGIGKTTVVHVALLLQVLKGKKVISLTREPYYITGLGEKRRHITGSGYIHFKKKMREHITGERITLSDVMDALEVPDDVRISEESVKIGFILKKIKEENTILFIDDFQVADESVGELVKSSENVVVCSRKKPDLALNHVHVGGMDDIDELIDLKSEGKISEEIKEKIKRVAEGHPVSTIILVKNYQRIDFDALENFKEFLGVTKEEYTEEFLRRVVEEVLTPEALEMLRDLAVLNPRLKSNIDVNSFEKVYGDGFRRVFGELVDTCIVEKREEGVYQFCFHHIQSALVEEKRSRHEIAAKYYGEKVSEYGSTEDVVEWFYHMMRIEYVSQLIDGFLSLHKKVRLIERDAFVRLTEVGEELRNLSTEEDKGVVSGTLGNLYSDLRRFEEAEEAYKEALGIYKELAEKNFDAYSPDLATTQNNLGTSYWNLRRFKEAEEAFKEALGIYKKLAEKNFDAYSPDLATTQNNLGTLYSDLRRFEEAEEAYKEALEIRKELAEKNFDAYSPYLATTQNNLGNLYSNLRRFEEAEEAYKEALEIRKKLAEKNFDVYSPDLAMTQISVGILYITTDRTKEGIDILEEAEKKNLPPDLRATCLAGLGYGHEILKDQRAPSYYFCASANYFILFNLGVQCLDDVLYYLAKAIELDTGEIRKDALLMRTAIEKLSNPQKKIKIPEISHSKRGKTITEAFKGKKFQFEPKDEIDAMALILAEKIRSSH